MRILIADDHRSCGLALADMVRYCGHDVIAVVASGLEAIQAYTLHKPDLVLMDHWMPRLNGVTASRHIIAKNPAARIVLLSAWSPLDGADESGAVCFLPKPVELARLSATLLTISQSISPFCSDFPSSNSDFPSSNSDLPSPISDLPSPASDLHAPSSSLLPSGSDLHAPSSVPIPQEIISPIETFPVETFPIAIPETRGDIDQSKIVQLPVSRKAPRKRRRNSRRRQPAC
ncbi:MAG TPA: response regulator [Chthoniobacterales bacterium]